MIFLVLKLFVLATLLYILARPVAKLAFSGTPFEGVPQSLAIALAGWSWLVWIHVGFGIPMSTPLVWILLIAAAIASGFLQWKQRERLPLTQIEKIAFAKSLILISVLSGIYLFARQFNSDINNLEKFPDLAFVSASFFAKSLPPLDPFAAGETINYYYFGHFQAATMARALGHLPNEQFHLQVALLFALSFLSLVGVGGMLIKIILPNAKMVWRYFAGLVSAFWGVGFGNLQPFFEIVIKKSPNYFYPTATRWIETVIHEFPFYSFLVGDLHGHVMNLPLAVTTIGVALFYFEQLLTQKNRSLQQLFQSRLQLQTLGLLGFLAGTSYVTNAWDIVTLLLLAGFLWLAVEVKDLCQASTQDRAVWQSLQYLLIQSGIVVSIAILCYLPYWFQFVPPTRGIGFVPPEKSTPLMQFFIIWGLHVPLGLLILFSRKLREQTVLFVFAAVGVGLFLLTELVFLRDIYPTHFRANTVFKIGFIAWIILSLAAGSFATLTFHLASRLSSTQRLFNSLVLGFLFAGGVIYLWVAPKQSFLDFKTAMPMDGTKFIELSSPDDLLLIDYVQESIPSELVVLEAVGDSFSQFGRISAFTGRQTVIQWPVHEWLWRGSYGESLIPKSKLESETGILDTVGKRVEDVQKIYTSTGLAELKELIAKYKIAFVVVGKKEKEKYPTMNIELIKSLGQITFEKNETFVIAINDENRSGAK